MINEIRATFYHVFKFVIYCKFVIIGKKHPAGVFEDTSRSNNSTLFYLTLNIHAKGGRKCAKSSHR